MSAGVLRSNGRRMLTVWNWHGDTDRSCETIPRVLYSGPADQYRRDSAAGSPKRNGRRK